MDFFEKFSKKWTFGLSDLGSYELFWFFSVLSWKNKLIPRIMGIQKGDQTWILKNSFFKVLGFFWVMFWHENPQNLKKVSLWIMENLWILLFYGFWMDGNGFWAKNSEKWLSVGILLWFCSPLLKNLGNIRVQKNEVWE